MTTQEETLRQEQVSYAFLRAHLNDFNNCEANVALIADHLKENRLDWTLDNLETAFKTLKPKLAPVKVSALPVVPTITPEEVRAAVQVRPAAPVADPTLTFDEIKSWDGPTMRKKMQNPATKAEIDRVVAAENAARRKS